MSLGSWALPATAWDLTHVTRAGRAQRPQATQQPLRRGSGAPPAPPWRRASPFAGSGDRGPPARAAGRFPPPPAAGSSPPRAEEKSRRPRAEAARGRVVMVTAGDKEPAAPGVGGGGGGGAGLRGPPRGPAPAAAQPGPPGGFGPASRALGLSFLVWTAGPDTLAPLTSLAGFGRAFPSFHRLLPRKDESVLRFI